MVKPVMLLIEMETDSTGKCIYTSQQKVAVVNKVAQNMYLKDMLSPEEMQSSTWL